MISSRSFASEARIASSGGRPRRAWLAVGLVAVSLFGIAGIALVVGGPTRLRVSRRPRCNACVM